MRNSNLVILQAIARALINDILPAAQAPAAAQQGKYVLALLGLLASREPGGLMSAAQEQGAALLDTMRQILKDGDLATPRPPSHGYCDDRYQPGMAQFQQTEAELCSALSALLAAQSTLGDQALAHKTEAVLDQFARTRLRLDEDLLGQPEHLAVTSEDAPASPLPDMGKLQSYLQEKLPAYAAASVTGLSAAAFSLGKQITFIDMQMADGTRSDLVMRQEKAVKIWETGDSTAVKDEFRVLQVVRSLDLPVPEPLLLDTSGELGPTFMLMPKVRGAAMGEVFKSFTPLAEETIMQIAEIMAKLHGAGLEPFADFLRDTGRGEVLGMTTREAMYSRICEWERTCSAPEQFPNPTKVWLFDWLKRNIPENMDRPVFVHGDFGLHNLLAEDGRITASLDREWSHVGNAVEDIAYMRPHIDQYSSWDRFVQHYAAHGGPELRLSDDIVKFNACLSNVIFSALSGKMAWFVERGGRTDMASVFGGDWYGYEFERMALRAALQASAN